MDQHKHGQQGHGEHPDQSRSQHQGPMPGDRSAQQNQEPAEGSRENVNTGRNANTERNKGQRPGDRGSNADTGRGMGSSAERNSGGISNRGMDPSMEQRDVPERGSNRESER